MEGNVLTLVGKPEFQQLQLSIDRDIAAQAQARGCRDPDCDGNLHVGHFERKPRGAPVCEEYCLRFSFCCDEEDCRKRSTPPSVRFLGPKVYISSVVVLVTVLRHGVTPARLKTLQELLSVSRQTVLRWKQWWTKALPRTDFWTAARGLLRDPVQSEQLPASLLDRFSGDLEERLLFLLRFITPLTGGRRWVPVL